MVVRIGEIKRVWCPVHCVFLRRFFRCLVGTGFKLFRFGRSLRSIVVVRRQRLVDLSQAIMLVRHN
jgi:hypothetical protein